MKKLPFLKDIKLKLIFIAQHFSTSEMLERKRLKYVKEIKETLPKKGRILNVDRVKDITPQEFHQKYLSKSLPVIFENETQTWDFFYKWNLHFLKDTYPDLEVNIIETPGLVENGIVNEKPSSTQVLSKIKMKDFIENLYQGSKQYLKFCPLIENDHSLTQSLNTAWLHCMRKSYLGVSYQNFIGPAGRRTPLHSETLPFFYIMVEGEKKWTLYHPSFFSMLHPSTEGRGYIPSMSSITNGEFDQVDRWECTIKKGDILFVPAWMWHEVENVTHSWGLSYQFTDLGNILKFPIYAFTRVFLSKPNFLKILFLSFFRKDKREDKNLLTPKVFTKD